MTDPTLFDELAELGRQDVRFGVDPRPLCPADVRTIELWEEVGIPADLTTVEHACDLLMSLWRERATWLGLVDELLDGER